MEILSNIAKSPSLPGISAGFSVTASVVVPSASLGAGGSLIDRRDFLGFSWSSDIARMSLHQNACAIFPTISFHFSIIISFYAHAGKIDPTTTLNKQVLV